MKYFVFGSFELHGSSKFESNGYHSIDLEAFYISSFGSEVMGRSVRPQLNEKGLCRSTPSIDTQALYGILRPNACSYRAIQRCAYDGNSSVINRRFEIKMSKVSSFSRSRTLQKMTFTTRNSRFWFPGQLSDRPHQGHVRLVKDKNPRSTWHVKI